MYNNFISYRKKTNCILLYRYLIDNGHEKMITSNHITNDHYYTMRNLFQIILKDIFGVTIRKNQSNYSILFEKHPGYKAFEYVKCRHYQDNQIADSLIREIDILFSHIGVTFKINKTGKMGYFILDHTIIIFNIIEKLKELHMKLNEMIPIQEQMMSEEKRCLDVDDKLEESTEQSTKKSSSNKLQEFVDEYLKNKTKGAA